MGSHSGEKAAASLVSIADWMDIGAFPHHIGAATRRRDGVLQTAGGRVLTVTASGADFAAARARAYEAVRLVGWEGEHHRSDVGVRAIEAAAAVK